MRITEATNYKQQIEGLLTAEKLPSADLPLDLRNFRVAIENDKVIGIAGIEIYGNYGLVRSLVTEPAYRGRGIAGKLLTEIEHTATVKNLKAVYLLTETAPEYFRARGYIQIMRAEVPAEVQQSSEFSFVCPQSAVVMSKMLTDNK